MPKNMIESHSYLNAEIIRLASLAKHPFARDCGKMLKYFYEIEKQLSSTYEWKFTPTNALIEQLSMIENHAEWNNIYWRDIVENMQAFSILSYRRGLGIIRPAIRSLNTGEFLAAAVLARSALELSAWSIYHSTKFRNIVLPSDMQPEAARFTANDLQTQLVKVLWGTRLETEHDELRQLNIIGILDKLSKKDTTDFLRPAYEYLCDATHPNIVGNAEFWQYPSDASRSQSFTIKINTPRSVSSPNQLLEFTLGALGWSGMCIRNSMLETHTAIEQIGQKLLIRKNSDKS